MAPYKPKYAMFFDNHTMRACPDVGHFLDAEDFAQKLSQVGVDLLGFHAKCNQGFCYYDTAIGQRHPSLPAGLDMFGETLKACSRRGIRVNAYVNCGLSNEDGIRHPEWCRVDRDGGLLHPEVLGWVSPFLRQMCFNTPYAEYILSIIREIRDKYPVTGFLFDSFNDFPCYCPACRRQMRAEGVNLDSEAEVMAFAARSNLRFAERIASVVKEKGGDYMSYYLGVTFKDNARIGSYLECECLPTNRFTGYEQLPLCARHLRTLRPDGAILNMTGRFCDWGDFGSLRTQIAVEYDLFYGLANGMRPNFSDHFPPSGRLFPAVYERAKAIYRHLQEFEPWYDGAVNETEVAVLLPGACEKTPSLCACERILTELRMQFDLIDRDFADYSRYKVLVLPDKIRLDAALASRLRDYLRGGGRILATGESGLSVSGDVFALDDWGVDCQGECETTPVYFRMLGDFASGMSDLPLIGRSPGLEVRAKAGAQVIGTIVTSYYDKRWDGVYSTFYAPPAVETDRPFAVLTDRVAYCPFALFESHYEQASSDMRILIGNLLAALLPRPLLRCALPSFGKAFVTRQPGRRMVHFLNYMPELRGRAFIVEDELTAENVQVALRLDGQIPAKVTLAPDGRELDFTVRDGYVEFEVPKVTGYGLAVVTSAEEP